ncbi:MAG: DUF5011 domain-containing protein, partial [Saprospiraceae bacterium]
YQTTYLALDGTVRLDNVILQGYNTVTPGVTYDIYWDNFVWREVFVAPTCEGIVTFTFDYTDPCNDLVYPWTYTYTVDDNVLPSLTGPAYVDNTSYNSCIVNAQTSVPAWSETNAIQGYTDNCGASVTATLTGTATTGTDCSWTVTYTYTVYDECNNPLPNQSYSYSGSDQTLPSLTGSAYVDNTSYNSCIVHAQTTVPPWSVTNAIQGYTDNCGASVTATLTGTATTGTDCSWTVTYTYTVYDECNNPLPNQSYSYSGNDQTLPTITLLGDPTVYICFGETYIDAGATADDNCNGDLTSEIMANNLVNTSLAGTYMVTYDVEDDCGNDAVQVSRTVIVRPHPNASISGTATVLQNAPMTPVVTFTGMDGTGPYTFYYSKQYNSDLPTYHWTNPPGNPVTVAQSNAVVGVFTYKLLKVVDFYGCEFDLPMPEPMAVITVISSCDLSPSIPRPINGSYTTAEVKQGVVQFTNAGPGPSSGLLTFRISNIGNFGIVIPAVSGTYAGLVCQNSSFTITAGPFFTTITTNAVIPSGDNLRIGYISTAIGSGGSNGNLTATVLNGTGGDNNNGNNKAVRTLVIN